MRRRTVLVFLALLLAAAPAAATVSPPATSAPTASIAAESARASAVTAEPGQAPGDGVGVCAGRMAEPADGVTVVSVQGARFDDGPSKTPARLLGYGPRGDLRWVYRAGTEHGVAWSYDVDPTGNGTVFVTATTRNRSLDHGSTLFFELDPRTGERLWTEERPFIDTHDADLVGEHRIAIAHMRNYDEESGENRDRLAIYNRTTDEIEWTWRFSEHYDRSVGGEYTEDWTHLNDVDYVPGRGYLLSPRNFDQVILVNRTTGDIDLKLGSDGDFSTLKKQHNPDYLESENGTPTFLVADSENERVVEYARAESGWTRTWTAGNASSLYWPRDADRLENGNTLIGDSRNNRVIEVTPEGEVVWEVYGPWLVYDAERIPGDGSNGPTAADMDAPRSVDLTNASPPSIDALERCDAAIEEYEGGFDGTWPAADPTAEPSGGSGSGDGAAAGGSGENGMNGDGSAGDASDDGGSADGGEGNSNADGAGGSIGLISEVVAGPPGGLVAVALFALLVGGAAVRAIRRE